MREAKIRKRSRRTDCYIKWDYPSLDAFVGLAIHIHVVYLPTPPSARAIQNNNTQYSVVQYLWQLEAISMGTV
jgi:hypothetical protein